MSIRGGRACILCVVTALALAGCASRAPVPASAPEDTEALRRGGLSHPSAVEAPTAPLAQELLSLFQQPDFAHAQIAVHVQSLLTGDTWLALNERQLLVPASNQKQLTAAVAARRLGWDFRYTTRVLAIGPVNDGTLEGDLVVVGSGDPTINPRHPERWAALDDWAAQIAARGVRIVSGSLIGDDNAFAEPGWGAGWSWDDLASGYGAPVSALQYHENQIEVMIGPGLEPGARAIISTSPPGSGMLVDHDTVTVGEGEPTTITLERVPGSNFLTVRGQIAVGTPPRIRYAAVDNPTQLFVNAFREALARKGIFVAGAAIDIDSLVRPPDLSRAETWVTDQSAPLWEMVDVLHKWSRNIYADTLLWTLAGTRPARDDNALPAPANGEAGLSVLRETLTELGVDSALYGAFDGSGLSRYDMLSASALTTLLTTIWRDPVLLGPYRSALPQAGVSGSLEHRMKDTAATGRVWAKTGSMFNVRTLAGYALTADEEPLVFAFFVNNFKVPASDIDALMDAALVTIAEYRAAPPSGSVSRQLQ